jgi:hypothetical protein
MIKNILLHTLKYLCVALPVEISGILLLPFILPFIAKDKEFLPKWCRWFDNHEYHLKDINGHRDVDGLMGPTKERIKIGALVEKLSGTISYAGKNYEVNEDFGLLKTALYRYRWIALRNPAYYFKFVVMGWHVVHPMVVEQRGDLPSADPEFYEVGDQSYDRDGWYYVEVRDMGKTYFEFYYCKTYSGKRPGKGLRLRIGHKIGNPKEKLRRDKIIQFEFSPNPMMPIEGEDGK